MPPGGRLLYSPARFSRRFDMAIDLKPGQTMLEIGCGWGGFAEYAAKHHGTQVVGLTISREQHDFAVARMAKAGLSDKVVRELSIENAS